MCSAYSFLLGMHLMGAINARCTFSSIFCLIPAPVKNHPKPENCDHTLLQNIGIESTKTGFSRGTRASIVNLCGIDSIEAILGAFHEVQWASTLDLVKKCAAGTGILHLNWTCWCYCRLSLDTFHASIGCIRYLHV